MMKSFDAEATKVSLELTARSVMSPFQAYIMKYEDITRRTYKYVFIHREEKKKGVGRVEGGEQWSFCMNSLHVHGSWLNNMLFPLTRFLQGDHLNQ